MKYLITESQFDNMIFKYLDNQDFIIIKRKPNYFTQVFFANSENDTHAQMYYSGGRLIISKDLADEISSFFSIDEDDTQIVISEWVIKKLKVNIDIWDVVVYGGLIGDANLSL